MNEEGMTTRIGLLIPKKMSTFKDFPKFLSSVARNSSTEVTVSSTHLFPISNDVTVTIYGQPGDILAAIEMFLGRMPTDRLASSTIVLAIGALTPKDLRSINFQSGSYVKMFPTEYNYAGIKTRLVTVSGSRADQVSAMERILSKPLTPIPSIPGVNNDLIPFQNSFYTEVAEISMLTEDEATKFRSEHGVSVSGADILNPVRSWSQLGLVTKILEKIKQEVPTPFESQLLPILLSGKDCIAFGNCGKVSYIVTVLTHVLQYRQHTPQTSKDSPIGLILAATKEEAVWISSGPTRRLSK